MGDTPDTLQWLIEGPGKTLNRNEKMRKGEEMTPLMCAVRAARPENVRVLCQEAPDQMLKAKDVFGMTPMYHVAESYRKDRLETAKALMECGGDPNIFGDARLLNKMTP